MSNLNEKTLQLFIADYPWLINPNYENIPGLKKNGLEYQVGDKKRIDLLLRDRISLRPVIVEFKIVPFYRENIGQILEYKARVASIMNKEENELYKIFGDYVSVPELILIVEECDDFSRIACNMSGINVYEYKNFAKTINEPKLLKNIGDIKKSYEKILPITYDREEEINNKIYKKIKNVLNKYNNDNAWSEPNSSSGYFFPELRNIFINRNIFKDEVVSIGIYEDLENENTVIICYYGTDKDSLELFEKDLKKNDKRIKLLWDEENDEGYINYKFSLNKILNEVDTIFEEILKNYKIIMKTLQ